MQHIIFLIVIGSFAGIIASVVGMASLISYPALLSLGIPPVMANASNTVALIGKGFSSIAASLEEIKHHLKLTIEVTALTFLGGIVGAFLLIKGSNNDFAKIVPFLIFLAACSMLMPKKKASYQASSKLAKVIEFLILLAMGIYTGYFGSGAGVIMIAVLSRIMDAPYRDYNAIRNVATLAANLIASVIFIVEVPVDWTVIIPLGIGFIVGGYIGPKIVRKIPTNIMRNGVCIFAFILSICLFIKAYM